MMKIIRSILKRLKRRMPEGLREGTYIDGDFTIKDFTEVTSLPENFTVTGTLTTKSGK